MVKNLPAKQEMQVWSWVRKISWRRKWKHTLVFLTGKSHGQRSPRRYSPWGCKESDVTDKINNRKKQPIFSSVQSLSRVWLFATPWTAACQASLSITNSWSPPRSMSIESVMPSNHLILYRPLLFPPLIFPSIRVFSNKSALHIRYPKYWSFSFSISPSNEYSGLIDWLTDWLTGSPCSPKDSQESSSTPQFKSINSLVLSFLYSPSLTSIHDHWKNHSLD